MRSLPSVADRELISSAKASAGVEVTPTQLERWRSRGLIPRAQVVRPSFGGSHVLSHGDELLGAVALLAQVSRRSRPWQYSALALFDEGFSLSVEALRATAMFLVQLSVKPMAKAWRIAELEAAPSEDPDEEMAEIGERAASILPRPVWNVVREEVTLAHPFATVTQLREFVDRAMTWRLVDLNVPGRMTDTQRNLARHGVEDPMPVFGGIGVLPLPSERLQVANTLSWAEAETFREVAYAHLSLNPALQVGPFGLMTWIVTGARRNERPDALDVPLPQEYLIEELKATRESERASEPTAEGNSRERPAT